MDLKDRIALVTGGSRGIGRACCLALARKGCHVAVHYHRAADRADEVVAAIREMGRQAVALQADVSATADVRRMAAEARQALGPIDLVVSGAGIYADEGRPLRDLTDEQWDRTMAVNLRSTFLVCREVVGEMMERRRGKIVIIGSCAGVAGQWTTGYCASKAGQQGLAMSLAREMAPHNVHVNLVAPGGAIDTDMHAGWLPEAKRRWLDKRTPDGRWPLESGIGLPEDIAHAVVFAAENDFLCGEVLKVSGGTCICP